MIPEINALKYYIRDAVNDRRYWETKEVNPNDVELKLDTNEMELVKSSYLTHSYLPYFTINSNQDVNWEFRIYQPIDEVSFESTPSKVLTEEQGSIPETLFTDGTYAKVYVKAYLINSPKTYDEIYFIFR